MLVLQRLYIMLAVMAIVVLVAALGIRQYGNARVSAQELGVVKEAVSEAVVARTAAGKVDAKQAKEIVTKRDAVRRVIQKGRDEVKDIESTGCDAVGDAERIRLLNLRIVEVNRIITSSGELPK